MKRTITSLSDLLGLASTLSAGEPVDYLRDIKPLLSKRCSACHGALTQKAGLRLDTAAAARKGGESGPAIEPGRASESLMIEAVTGADGWRMPPEGEGEALSAEDVTRLRAWIDQGAHAPAELEPPDPRKHWAFRPPKRPEIPKAGHLVDVQNPIDAFLAAEQEARGLRPRPTADKEVLVRRVSLDLVGLVPTPEERRTFLADESVDAYERFVDRLLASPQYGERWGRHWMDVWRYSDWDGFGQEIRESQMHIWRWRDWIVESLNRDTGYDRMIVAMLAADEATPNDLDDLRATGYLARNWYKFNRNVWLDNTIEHTSKAFLGITLNCARCHDHKYDPVAQEDYYRFRAFFEPYQVRTDRVPGQADPLKDGLARVYDADVKAATFLFRRGDEKNPAKDRPLVPGVPRALGRGGLEIHPAALPADAYYPGLRDYVRAESLRQAQAELAAKQAELGKAKTELAERELSAVEANLAALVAKIAADDAKYADPARPYAESLALAAGRAERRANVAAAELALVKAEQSAAEAERAKKPANEKTNNAAIETQKKRDEARKVLEAARAALPKESAAYTPIGPVYPSSSSGRRLALARWIASRQNPLAARVAVNHIWMRHFGTPLVPTVFDFGLNGKPPTHPALLDWLAVELMDSGWSLKSLHRLIVTSQAYRRRSDSAGPADSNLAADPENRFLWRMNPRRMEAEVVRDNLLRVAGALDLTRGGPDLDPATDQSSGRRSLYFRHAKEKRATFLKLFDSANATACYRRTTSVVPQQALALANSPIAQAQARKLAGRLSHEVGAEASQATDGAFVAMAFERILGRAATAEELSVCEGYLVAQSERLADKAHLTPFAAGPAAAIKPAASPAQRAREDLVHVLFNHNDFITIR
jgi:hypothetical protein